jgi:hypothetical protein
LSWGVDADFLDFFLMRVSLVLSSFLIRVKHTMSGFELGFRCRFSQFLSHES